MGGAYTALARGVHAPAWNPANLGLPDNPRYSVTFVSAGAGVWNNSITKSMYDKYNGAHLSSADIEDILDHIPAGGLEIDADVSARAFSFSMNRFALSVGAEGESYMRADKTLLDLALRGNETNRRYSLHDTDGAGAAVGLVGFSWGQPVEVGFADAFAVGATFNFLYGIGYAHADKVDATLQMREYDFDLHAEYTLTHALGGLGWGLDIGAAAQLDPRWNVSLALTNVLGSVPWSRDVKKEGGLVHGDSLAASDLEDAVTDSSWTLAPRPFSNKLPSVLRFGCSYRRSSSLTLTADYLQGFTDSQSARTTPSFRAGAEWTRLSWLPLRTGIAIGGREGFATALGLGFRATPLVLDIALLSRGLPFPSVSEGYLCAFEAGYRQAP